MNTEEFRSGREKVEKIIGVVEKAIKTKRVLEPHKKIKQAQQIVDGLATGACDEIQTRSVRNMNMNINALIGKIEKLPAKKKPTPKKVKKK